MRDITDSSEITYATDCKNIIFLTQLQGSEDEDDGGRKLRGR